MGARGYRPPDDDRVTSRTDILDDLPQRHAREDLVPIIARMSQNATNVDPVYFEFFQRLKTGRRCSCWQVETEAQALCVCCFGTGVVVGYNKRGTKTEVFDVTYPNTKCANTTPDYTHPTRPTFWSLVKTAVYGTIEFDFPITSNIGKIDVFDIQDYQPEGTEIQYYVKAPSEVDFIQLTRAAVSARLGQKKLQIKVVMKRVSPSAPLPKLVCIRFSYKLIPHTEVRVDIPRVQESLTLEEFGIYQSFSSQTFFMDNTLKNVSTEDFMYNVRDGTRWKIIEVSDNRPLGMLTSWDLTARLVQDFESYTKVPLGELASKILPQYVKSIQTDKEDGSFVYKSDTNHLRQPGNRTQTSTPDGPPVTPPGQTDVSYPKREV